MERKVNFACIASGSGTDFGAIAEAYCQGFIPNVDFKFLVSTNKEAGCLKKATDLGAPIFIIDRPRLSLDEFNHGLTELLLREKIELVFLVGCVVKIPHIPGIIFRNIHPIDTNLERGRGKYGLETHMAVLIDIRSKVNAGLMKADDSFYTKPTIHAAAASPNEEYDTGRVTMQMSLKIPDDIIKDYLFGFKDLGLAAKELQRYVLEYEHQLLPLAVKIEAQQIIDSRRNRLSIILNAVAK